MKLMLSATALVLVAQPAFAQSMNAEQFYRRATALQGKGMLAVFSGSEIKVLTNEGQAAGAAAARQHKAAVAAGQKPRFCPPPGPATMGSDEFVRRLSAIPAGDRARIDMTEATNRILASKYPCKA